MINKYLQYNPETGLIIWVSKPSTRVAIGNIAGNIDKDGYIIIRFKNKAYKAHRLAWYLHYGEWPKNVIDHINGIKNDNRINNLRDVTNQQNQLNKKIHREKTVKYYHYNKPTNSYYVMKRINSKMTYFGCFKTEELARQFIQDNIILFKGG